VHHVVDLEALDKVGSTPAEVAVQSKHLIMCVCQIRGMDVLVDGEDVPWLMGQEVLTIRQIKRHLYK
jgi:hypothetical protein